MRAMLLGIALIGAACGPPGASDAGAPDASLVRGPFVPGISGGPLLDRIAVVVVDELTREPIDARVTVEPRGLDPATGPSPFVHASAERFDRADVSVVVAGEPTRRVRWIAVGGARVVIPVPRRETRRVEVDVRGVAPSGTSAVDVTSLAPLRVLRSDGIGGASARCPSLDACRVALEVPAGTTALVATASRADAVPLGFAMAALDAAIDFDAAARAPVSIAAALPPPDAGIDAVVGVPGLTTDHQLARLPAASASTFVVPALEADLAGASWWILARADAADRTSTVVQRGLRDPSDAGEWPPFLGAPELVVRASLGDLAAEPPAGATLFVVERLDAIDEEITLYFEAAGPIAIDAPASPGRVVVRAVDAGAIDASEVDLDAIEAASVRWSEASWTE